MHYTSTKVNQGVNSSIMNTRLWRGALSPLLFFAFVPPGILGLALLWPAPLLLKSVSSISQFRLVASAPAASASASVAVASASVAAAASALAPASLASAVVARRALSTHSPCRN